MLDHAPNVRYVASAICACKSISQRVFCPDPAISLPGNAERYRACLQFIISIEYPGLGGENDWTAKDRDRRRNMCETGINGRGKRFEGVPARPHRCKGNDCKREIGS
ncbi:hypothetical protein ARMGADRAFT_1010751 [Armillaria gallica]|uniref:Uncharacterized protein n=1 Tax=Armillaria gallica TaxID=47427 RepID=A0A2H3E3C4_ARMGA|nr:hypothetical protein ARMGADRAFT_1010751 [Armillaria gallica]